DLTTSRILCPRHLASAKTYHAFVIPTFESGRLAGLGVEVPADLGATHSSWADGQDEFPYYYRWRFGTGFGDFDYLVRLLKPQSPDPRVGRRDIDVVHPGQGLPKIDSPPEIHGILKLGGALQAPLSAADQAAVQKYDEWDHPQPPAPPDQRHP